MLRKWPTGVRVSLPKALTRTLSTTTTTISSSSSSPSSSPSQPAFAMKNVTRKNFASALETLRATLRDADFVALDVEMTGVVSAPWRESFEFDRPDVRYLKVKDSAEKFAVVQFGVCPFRWEDSSQTLIAYPHNFYIFPRKELSFDLPSHEFLCQTTSIGFLAKHQFNFNTCIHEGISYISREQEIEVVQYFRSNDDRQSVDYYKEDKNMWLTRTADLLFTERMKLRFREWRDDLLGSQVQLHQFEEKSGDCSTQVQTIFYKMRPSLLLTGFTSHQLRLIQQVIRSNFKDLLYVRWSGKSSDRKTIVMYTHSEDDKALLMEEISKDLIRERESELEAAVGFRHVIDLLSAEKKLIVGHNCLLDFAHVYHKFIGALPPTVEEFASGIHKSFPCIMDTKHLLRAELTLQRLLRKSSTSLSSAFARLCPQIAFGSNDSHLSSDIGIKVEVQTDETRSAGSNSGAKHEAGYDAFMTGCIFAQACKHLGIKFKAQMVMDLFEHQTLQKHANLLYLGLDRRIMVHLGDGKVMKFSHPAVNQRYPTIIFPNIILLWGFQKGMKPRELKDSMIKIFGSTAITSVFFVDKSAALIQFSNGQLVSDFLVLKDSLEKSGDLLSVLHPLAKLLEGGKTRAARYDVYREICSSSSARLLFAEQAETLGFTWKTKLEMEDAVGTEKQTNGIEKTGEELELVSIQDNVKKDAGLSGEKVLDALLASSSSLRKKLNF
ncbi:poly(A)-specific ribonuclease PARN isoform X1 [Nymphaea colorata]|nr:poly(A)-specific ribonuclease PARN isoform X1 [Nymphaea colorata]